ncbi:hypothetical protein [Amycolatopsis taiwanensis]|uniref:Uncharacterized protein n=1 Tax=Amycolatopsis taiwanensis TaxID=342230 RepID=A0A9W6QVI2_9PSEU|nr:hypothetical protein [Amycolatopsis taiwanensis]GLY64349.1 hypothetical protein Atai01_09680 [Amycolatopsis taiwanensis]
MNEMTTALVTALKAVNHQVPCIIDALVADTLPAGKQREFGGLLIALGELLKEYADAAGGAPIPPRGPAMPLK